MKIPFYQVDAFATEPFHGNPAAVCLLEAWLDDDRLLAIAAENNLSETAFVVAGNAPGHFELRWFTPVAEVDLCGHATLAAAYVLFERMRSKRHEVSFRTRRWYLTAHRGHDGSIILTMPALPAVPCDVRRGLGEALGLEPRETLAASSYLAVFEAEEDVVALKPDMRALALLDLQGVIVTAAGSADVDFVSRYFAPKLGVPEDPVCGSAHCSLVPYWSRRLGKRRLRAVQRSARGGELGCEDRGDNVALMGHAVLFSEGYIQLP